MSGCSYKIEKKLSLVRPTTGAFSWPLFIWSMVVLYTNHYFVFIFNIMFLFYWLVNRRAKTILLFKGWYFFVLYCITGLFGGLIHYVQGSILFSDFFRDALYWASPFLALLIAGKFRQIGVSFKEIVNTFAVVFFFFSLSSFLRVGLNALHYGFRLEDSANDPQLYFFLAILLTKRLREQITVWRKTVPWTIFFTLLCFAVSFSRTSILTFALAYIVFNWGGIGLKRLIKIVLLALFLFLTILLFTQISYSFKNVFDTVLRKIANSFNEISSFNDWTPENIVRNWRGYERYCALIEFQKGNFIEKLFGYGWGKGFNVGGYGYLVVDRTDDLIPVLHNGYVMMLVKGGVVCLLSYIVFYVSNLVFGMRQYKLSGLYVYKVYVASIITYSVITVAVRGFFGSSLYMFSAIFFIGYFGSGGTINKSFERKSSAAKRNVL